MTIDAATLQVIVVILQVLAGGGLLAGYAQLRKIRGEVGLLDAQTSKLKSEAKDVAAQAWSKLVHTLGEDIADLRQREDEYRDRIQSLEQAIEELREWIKEQGLTPPPRPPRTRKRKE